MSYDQIKQSLLELLNEKRYEKVEEFFLEKFEENSDDLNLIFFITNEVRKRANGATRASDLLLLILPEYEKMAKWNHVLEVGRKIYEYYPKYHQQREFMIKAYRALYSDISQIDEFISYSRLGDETIPLSEGLQKIEFFIRYRPGGIFYFERFGVGEIREIKFNLNKLIVDFEKQPGYSVEFKIADNFLQQIAPDHFLSLRYKSPLILTQMVEEEPIKALLLLLQSEKKTLSGQEIKSFFTGIIPADRWDSYWKKVSKLSEKDPNVHISVERPRRYSYASSAESADQKIIDQFDQANWIKKIDIYNRAIVNDPKTLEYFLNQLIEMVDEAERKENFQALEIALSLGLKFSPDRMSALGDKLIGDSDKILPAIRQAQLTDSVIRILDHARKNFPDWVQLYKDAFYLLEDPRYFDGIINELRRQECTSEINEMFDNIKTNYGKNPHQFLWFCKKAFSQKEYQEYLNSDLLYRLLEMIVFFSDAAIWKKGVTQLSASNFLFVERCLKDAKLEEAQRVLDFLKIIGKLDDYQKKEILNIMQHRFPSLFKKEEDNTFFAFAETIEKKRLELENLIKKEIPENAKEIGNAASYGDLRENFEYKAAKDRQQLFMTRASQLDQDLKRVRALKLDLINNDMIGVGTHVWLNHIDTGEEKELIILGPWEADSEHKIYSYLSSFVQKIIGKHVDDNLLIEDQVYRVKRIEKVTRLPDA